MERRDLSLYSICQYVELHLQKRVTCYMSNFWITGHWKILTQLMRNENRIKTNTGWTHWLILRNLKSPVGNEVRSGLLFRVANIVLITPHSNAGIESVYNLVNENKPVGSERNRLDIDGLLASILAVKSKTNF